MDKVKSFGGFVLKVVVALAVFNALISLLGATGGKIQSFVSNPLSRG